MTNHRVPLPDKEYLEKVFDYCAEDGILYWSKNRPKEDFLTEYSYARYLKYSVGKRAGYMTKPAKLSRETSGYWKVNILNKEYMLHRIIFKMFTNLEPLIIDHVNNNHLDNRIENLRESTRVENKMKSPKVNNKTGHRGVFSRGDRASYEVRITLPSEYSTKDMHVGYYFDLEEAAQAYNIAMQIFHKEILFYRNITDFPASEVDVSKSFFKKHLQKE